MVNRQVDEIFPYGTSPLFPIPSNTFGTAYPAQPKTQIVIMNANNANEVVVTSDLFGGKTYISILPAGN